MKTLKYLLTLAFVGGMMVACDTDVENIEIQKPYTYSDLYYQNLRDFKASDHEISFMWFAQWSGQNSMAVRFGSNLKMLRQINNESLCQLANIWSIEKSTLTLYEYGMRMPALDCIEMISHYYNITIDDILHSEPSELKRKINKRRYPNPLVRAIKGTLNT